VVTVDDAPIDGDEFTLVDDGAPHTIVIRPRPLNRST
jgi:hypothetical protein